MSDLVLTQHILQYLPEDNIETKAVTVFIFRLPSPWHSWITGKEQLNLQNMRRSTFQCKGKVIM